jgi:hypothetical protein
VLRREAPGLKLSGVAKGGRKHGRTLTGRSAKDIEKRDGGHLKISPPLLCKDIRPVSSKISSISSHLILMTTQ